MKRRSPGLDRAGLLTAFGVELSPSTNECATPKFPTKPWKNGYWGTSYRGHKTYLHRLILELNQGDVDLPREIQARHTCGKKLCVNRNHIIPGSIADNMADQYQLGERVMNERHPHCRVSTDDARVIRDSPRGVSTAELAARYGISPSYVNQIRAGTRRMFLDQEPRVA
jgi:hypothetical protein